MANWQERMRQVQEQVQEEEKRKNAESQARVDAEVRDRTARRESADRIKKDERDAGFNKGRELTKVLGRINVHEMLREISQQVWGGLGEIRNSYSTYFNRGTETTGLYWDFEIDKLIPEKHVVVESRDPVTYNEFGGNDRKFTISQINMPISLKRVREKKTSALVVYAYTELPDKYNYSQFPGKTHLYVGDHFGLSDLEGQSGKRVDDNGYGILVLGDGVADIQVQAFIEDSFAKSCLYRTENKLLPFQLKDRVSEFNSSQERRVQQNRKLIPWYKR